VSDRRDWIKEEKSRQGPMFLPENTATESSSVMVSISWRLDVVNLNGSEEKKERGHFFWCGNTGMRRLMQARMDTSSMGLWRETL
jgi:hypothetical protein